MAGPSRTQRSLEPSPLVGVYLVSIDLLPRYLATGLMDARPVRAWAPHPEYDDLIYVTTEHPETLAFLPEPYVEAS